MTITTLLTLATIAVPAGAWPDHETTEIGSLNSLSSVVNVGGSIEFVAKSRESAYIALFLLHGDDFSLIWRSDRMEPGMHRVPDGRLFALEPGLQQFLLVLSTEPVDWFEGEIPSGIPLDLHRAPPPPGPSASELVSNLFEVDIRAPAPEPASQASSRPVALEHTDQVGEAAHNPDEDFTANKPDFWVSTTRPRYRINDPVYIVIDSEQAREFELWLDAPQEEAQLLARVATRGNQFEMLTARATAFTGHHRLELRPRDKVKAMRGLVIESTMPVATCGFHVEGDDEG